jgi:hypothetical protein
MRVAPLTFLMTTPALLLLASAATSAAAAERPTPIGPKPLSGVDRPGDTRADADEDVRKRFVGGWRLVWLEEPGADGTVHRADCTGMLVFTREGHMSVQVMYRRPESHAGAGPVQYAQGGYEATFGRYVVDPRTRTFTYDVEGALVRSLVGAHLTRAFELSGNRMIVRSSNPDERWRVAWERDAGTGGPR